MKTIGQAFQQAKAQGRAAFIPYVTGGHPEADTCARLIAALDAGGADIIEVGLPFSDPMADGPVIQRASKLALDAGATPAGVLEMLAGLSSQVEAPLVLMTYYNPVLAMGLERFARAAAGAGVAGVIVPDLPPGEAAPWLEAARAAGLDTIFLVTPSTTDARLQDILKVCSGFVYYVSMHGVTGSELALDAGRLAGIQRVRRLAGGLPVAVGFGVATPSQAAALAQAADGVIVGSALVRRVLEADSGAVAVASVQGLAGELRAALAP